MKRLPLLRTKAFATIALCAVALSGCGDSAERREIRVMPDMYDSPAVKAQEPTPFFPDGNGSRHPVKGTIQRGFEPSRIAWNQPELSDAMPNPLPKTKDVVETGRRYFNTYCIACHGWNGNGVTPVTEPGRMPMPPVLYSDKVMTEWVDGRIYHTITHGQGNMPGYAEKLTPEQRWAVVHYVRVLQLAARPSEAQVQAFVDAGSKGFENDNPLAPKPPVSPFPEK